MRIQLDDSDIELFQSVQAEFDQEFEEQEDGEDKKPRRNALVTGAFAQQLKLAIRRSLTNKGVVFSTGTRGPSMELSEADFNKIRKARKAGAGWSAIAEEMGGDATAAKVARAFSAYAEAKILAE